MKPSLVISIFLLLAFTVTFYPSVSYAMPRNIYGVKKFSPTRMAGTKRLSKRSFTNSSTLYGVRKSTSSSSRMFGGLRNNYFGSGISNTRSGNYDDYQYDESKHKTVCYGEARSLCNSM